MTRRKHPPESPERPRRATLDRRGPDPYRSGIGLRAPHYGALARQAPPLGFLEVHSENFFGEGGASLAVLERFRADYPVSLHGVGLSLGSTDRLDKAHLASLARLVRRIEPALVSEHLSWSSTGGRFANDLLPLPLTDESLRNVTRRVQAIQERLGRAILVENVSTYLEYSASTIPEWEFLAEVSRRTGCGILLDVNNVCVNAANHGFEPRAYLDGLPEACVDQYHLGGYELSGKLRIDTHGRAVSEEAWALYGDAVRRFGAHPTLIEWDTDIPPLGTLLEHARRADAILAELGPICLTETG